MDLVELQRIELLRPDAIRVVDDPGWASRLDQQHPALVEALGFLYPALLLLAAGLNESIDFVFVEWRTGLALVDLRLLAQLGTLELTERKSEEGW